MEHSFFLNALSLPAASSGDAYDMLYDAFQGTLQLVSGDDIVTLCYDDELSTQLKECVLADKYTYSDFLNDLQQKNEEDFYLTLLEFEDKSPALEIQCAEDESFLEELCSCSFHIPSEPYRVQMDVLNLTWFLEATLLSLPTHDRWTNYQVEIHKSDSDGRFEESLKLFNISDRNSGVALRQYYDSFSTVDLISKFTECTFSNDFITWYGTLTDENGRRVLNKLALAVEKNFSGGEPLFKTLHDADGLRELRMRAYPGGAIRILFGALPNNRHAILRGFIKKSDNEGYDTEISSALELWNFYLE